MCRTAADLLYWNVAPREGRVSRNAVLELDTCIRLVAPREGRVSRNGYNNTNINHYNRRAPRGACE